MIVLCPKDDVDKLVARQRAEKTVRQAEARARLEHSLEDVRARAESELKNNLPGANEAKPSEIRTFHDVTGRFAVEASYLGIVDGKVQLRKKDGKLISLASDKLSESDRQWVKQQQASGPTVKGGEDYAAIRGVWICTECFNNGTPDREPAKTMALFTEDRVKISNLKVSNLYKYGLDPTAAPKRCGMVIAKPSTGSFHAIYSLEAGKLRFCVPVVGQRFDQPVQNYSDYPKDFQPGYGRTTYVFKRAEKEKPADEASLSPQHKAALLALCTDFAENIKRLEEKKYSDFFEHFAAPAVREALEKQPQGLETAAKRMEQQAPDFIGLLKELSAAVPAFDESAGRATYDFAHHPLFSWAGNCSLHQG